MSDNGIAFQIHRLPDGGFLVCEGQGRGLFACSDVDDALGYLKDKLEAPAPAAPADRSAELKAWGDSLTGSNGAA